MDLLTKPSEASPVINCEEGHQASSDSRELTHNNDDRGENNDNKPKLLYSCNQCRHSFACEELLNTHIKNEWDLSSVLRAMKHLLQKACFLGTPNNVSQHWNNASRYQQQHDECSILEDKLKKLRQCQSCCSCAKRVGKNFQLVAHWPHTSNLITKILSRTNAATVSSQQVTSPVSALT